MVDPLLCLVLVVVASSTSPVLAGRVESHRQSLAPPAGAVVQERRQDAPTIADVVYCGWSPESPEPGAVLDLEVRIPADWTLEEILFDRLPVGFSNLGQGSHRATAGIGRDEPPGPRRLSLLGRGSDGRRFVADHVVEVMASRSPSESLDVESSLARPPADAWKRIYQESSARHWSSPDTVGLLPDRPWLRPGEGRITSQFGKARIFNGRPAGFHLGVDLAGRIGDPIRCPESGRVVTLREEYLGGLTLRVDHGQGWISHLMHLHGVEVELGDEVHRGERIATLGRSGRVTGPHLHWGVSWRGRYVDPVRLLEDP